MYVRKALYGLKSSGAAFRAHQATTLHDIGFFPSRADADVWLRAAVKPDGFEYYELVLCYVDDILSILHKAKAVLQEVQRDFKFKNDEIAPPDMYLGGQVQRMSSADGVQGWALSSEKYVKSAIENDEQELEKKGLRLPT